MPYKDLIVRKQKAHERTRKWRLDPANRIKEAERSKIRMAAYYNTPEGRLAMRAANRKYMETLQGQDKARAIKRRHWLVRYGMSLSDYDDILARQGGGCAICGLHERDHMNGHLNVDHDHGTGKTRSLLCGKCNSGLGLFGDSIELLEAAAAYLRAHQDGNFVAPGSLSEKVLAAALRKGLSVYKALDRRVA